MNALPQVGLNGRMPLPPEKRFLITWPWARDKLQKMDHLSTDLHSGLA